MAQGPEDIAQQLDEADELVEHLRLEQALRMAMSAWRSADDRGTPAGLALSVRGRLLGARVLLHQLRLEQAKRLVEEARALQRDSAGDQIEDVLYALRLLRCFRGEPRGVSPRLFRGTFSQDVLRLFAAGGAGLDARTHALLKLRHYEAVALSAATPHDLQREGYRALVAARTLLAEGFDNAREAREESLLDLINTIFWFRSGEMEKGRDFVEVVYRSGSVTPLQKLRRGFVVLTEVSAGGSTDEEIKDIALQFADRCLKHQMRAFAVRGLTLRNAFEPEAWCTTPLLEVIL